MFFILALFLIDLWPWALTPFYRQCLLGEKKNLYSRDIYVQGLSDFFKTALRQKPYATQVRYMSHCDIPFPKLSTPGY